MTSQKLHISNYLLAVLFAAYGLLFFFNAMAPEATPEGPAYRKARHLPYLSCFMHGMKN